MSIVQMNGKGATGGYDDLLQLLVSMTSAAFSSRHVVYPVEAFGHERQTRILVGAGTVAFFLLLFNSMILPNSFMT